MIDVRLGHSSWVVPCFLFPFPYPLVGLVLLLSLLPRVKNSWWRTEEGDIIGLALGRDRGSLKPCDVRDLYVFSISIQRQLSVTMRQEAFRYMLLWCRVLPVESRGSLCDRTGTRLNWTWVWDRARVGFAQCLHGTHGRVGVHMLKPYSCSKTDSITSNLYMAGGTGRG